MFNELLINKSVEIYNQSYVNIPFTLTPQYTLTKEWYMFKIEDIYDVKILSYDKEKKFYECLLTLPHNVKGVFWIGSVWIKKYSLYEKLWML